MNAETVPVVNAEEGHDLVEAGALLLDVREADEWEAGHAPEATWIPMGELKLPVPFEDPTCYPAPGEVLLYPGGVSETEILFPYGHCAFASKAGLLAANHLMTIVEGREHLHALGVKVLWEGALDIAIERI